MTDDLELFVLCQTNELSTRNLVYSFKTYLHMALFLEVIFARIPCHHSDNSNKTGSFRRFDSTFSLNFPLHTYNKIF